MGSPVLRPPFLVVRRRKRDGQRAHHAKRQDEHAKSDEQHRVHLMVEKRHDELPQHKNQGRRDECVQPEPMGLEVLHKTAKEFDDHQKGQDIGNDLGEGGAHQFATEQQPDAVDGLAKPHGHDHNDINDQNIHKHLHGLAKNNYGCVFAHIGNASLFPTLLSRDLIALVAAGKRACGESFGKCSLPGLDGMIVTRG